MGYGKRPYRVYLNGLYFPASPFSVLQPFLILWALCCPPTPLTPFTGRMNIYTLLLHRGSDVCVLEDGRECLDS